MVLGVVGVCLWGCDEGFGESLCKELPLNTEHWSVVQQGPSSPVFPAPYPLLPWLRLPQLLTPVLPHFESAQTLLHSNSPHGTSPAQNSTSRSILIPSAMAGKGRTRRGVILQRGARGGNTVPGDGDTYITLQLKGGQGHNPWAPCPEDGVQSQQGVSLQGLFPPQGRYLLCAEQAKGVP